jgi:D-alanyl-lipoteichoic acid acyltransferase DltB (MBOAT superfamily)
MSLINIVILSGVALLTGLIRHSGWRKYLILGLSVFAVYALQPNLPIRYLGFWLPTGTLAITVLSWILTSLKENRKWEDSWIAGVTIVGVISVIGISRDVGFLSFIIPSQPPQILQISIAISLILVAVAITLKLPASLASFWLILLVVVFILTKTPYLANSISVGLRNLNLQSIELASALDIRWLGFSYIAFRIIHTIRDRQTGRMPIVGLADYINYVIFFPTLTAGPIDRLDHFVKTFNEPFTDRREIMGEGGKRIFIGLFKKFVVADTLAIIALNSTNALQIRWAAWMWISLYAYALQIYFDFSGYTDIAIGMGRLLGMKLPENFSSPYLKPNLTQFWNNWHMTLTQWFRAYFFNPLTRSLRSGKRVWPMPVIILVTQLSTMLLIGLWHGVTLNFVLWGAWHGLGLFVHNRWSSIFNVRIQNWATTSIKKILVNVMGILFTFNFVAVGWVFFVLPSPEMSWQVIQKLFGGI